MYRSSAALILNLSTPGSLWSPGAKVVTPVSRAWVTEGAGGVDGRDGRELGGRGAIGGGVIGGGLWSGMEGKNNIASPTLFFYILDAVLSLRSGSPSLNRAGFYIIIAPAVLRG